jgi:hypothetical protein
MSLSVRSPAGTWLPEGADPTDAQNDLRELFQTLAD